MINKLINVYYLPLIVKVPSEVTVILGGAAITGTPSLYQVITGTGLPEARQARLAGVYKGRVWLAGPSSMMGGGWSSGVITVRRENQESEPAALTALHIATRPESLFCASCKA